MSIQSEDLVCKVTGDKGYVYGLVLDAYRCFGVDEEESNPKSMSGKIKVAWHPNGIGSNIMAHKIKLCDRSLVIGDVVQRADPKGDNQRGFVSDLRITCNLRVLGTEKYIYNIDTKHLQNMMEWNYDAGCVSLDSWIGTVIDVSQEVTLTFHDGARCVLKDALISSFVDINDSRSEHSEFVINHFYKNQELRGDLIDLEDAKWLTETSSHSGRMVSMKPHQKVYMVVEQVSIRSVEVDWSSVGNRQNDDVINPLARPPMFIEGENLKRLQNLDRYSHCHIQIGDKCFYPLQNTREITQAVQKSSFIPFCMRSETPEADEASAAVEVTEDLEANESEDGDEDDDEEMKDDNDVPEQRVPTKKRLKKGARKLSSPARAKKKGRLRGHKMKGQLGTRVYREGDLVPVEVTYTFTTVDVTWQDGSVERDVPSIDLEPTHNLDDTEFFPGDYVIDSSPSADQEEYCVVVKVDHSARTCFVRRFRINKLSDRPDELTTESEEVSAYEIKDHPMFGMFRPSNFVVHKADECGEPGLRAGLIVKMRVDGCMDVQHPDGSIAVCYPQQICFDISESDYDSSDGYSTCSEASGDDSWETEEEEETMTTESRRHDDIDKQLGMFAGVLEAIENLTLDITAKQTISKKMRRDIRDVCRVVLETELENTELESQVKLLESVALDIGSQPDGKGSGKESEGACGKKVVKSEATAEVNCEGDCRKSSKKSSSHKKKNMKVEVMYENDEVAKVEVSNDDTNVKFVNNALMEELGIVNEVAKEEVECDVKMEDCGTEDVVKMESCATVDETSSAPFGNQNKPDVAEICVQLFFSMSEKIMAKVTELTREQQDLTEPPINQGDLNGDVNGDVDGDVNGDVDGDVNGDVNKEDNDGRRTPSADDMVTERYSEVPETPEVTKSTFHVLQAFAMLDQVPTNHKFANNSSQPIKPRAFYSAVKKELTLLKASLPDGIYVRAYEQRLDMFTVMITGPINTPYEDGLFFFDVQFPPDYPSSPPSVHYISYTHDRLNPNLYDDGTVCVSLLGTWSGKGSEKWTPRSTLLQVLISIQGLILVSEPYFNEPGYENEKGSLEAYTNSKMYNEMALIKLVQSMTGIVRKPPEAFEKEARYYAQTHVPRMIERIEKWVRLSPHANVVTSNHVETAVDHQRSASPCDHHGACNCAPSPSPGDIPVGQPHDAPMRLNNTTHQMQTDCDKDGDEAGKPEFPLLPLSRGMVLSMRKQLNLLKTSLIDDNRC